MVVPWFPGSLGRAPGLGLARRGRPPAWRLRSLGPRCGLWLRRGLGGLCVRQRLPGRHRRGRLGALRPKGPGAWRRTVDPNGTWRGAGALGRAAGSAMCGRWCRRVRTWPWAWPPRSRRCGCSNGPRRQGPRPKRLWSWAHLGHGVGRKRLERACGTPPAWRSPLKGTGCGWPRPRGAWCATTCPRIGWSDRGWIGAQAAPLKGPCFWSLGRALWRPSGSPGAGGVGASGFRRGAWSPGGLNPSFA